jgi:hypothetical protein
MTDSKKKKRNFDGDRSSIIQTGGKFFYSIAQPNQKIMGLREAKPCPPAEDAIALNRIPAAAMRN